MRNDWSQAASACWGKTNPGTGRSLSLPQHLEDSAGVIKQLWSKQPDNIRSLFIQCFDTEEAAVAFLTFCAGVHDLGKASTHFAFKAELVGMGHLCGRMATQGLVGPARIPHPQPHAVLGQAHLKSWLKRRFHAKPLRANRLTCIIGGHHGDNPTASQIEDAQAVLQAEPGPWHEVRDEICDRMAELTGADMYLPRWADKGIPITIQVLTEALVIMADWIASNENLFPYGEPSPTDRRVRSAMARLRLPGPWSPRIPSQDADALFRMRFPAIPDAHPNAIQSAILEAARSMTAPGLLALEAPMGEGKTEAAQLAAEVLAARFGMGGVFFGLPTMATSNPMFSRVRAWLDQVPGQDTASISLAHSKAGLNDEYQGLMPWNQSVELYDESAAEDGSRAQASALVHSWFMGRKRAILANHVVGTIDQALFAGLKAKHVVLRHLGLASKVVIIDEVHAADEYMRTYLKRVLEWLGCYHTPVILMSATLPPAQRQELVAAYTEGYTGGEPADVPDTDNAYPLLTLASSTVVSAPVPTQTTPTHVDVVPLDDSLETLVNTVRRELINGGCAGVIRNTVGRAQATFELLRQELDCEVVLVHSRFLAPHRAAKEAELIARLGRDSACRPERIVVVGTQVLEQSLDIDFDLLITDIAPGDLVLQRIGRLHRHQRVRPRGLEVARCYLAGVDNWSTTPPKLSRGSRAVYGDDPLLRAAAAFMDVVDTGITLPSDIPRIVSRCYRNHPEVPDSWQPTANAAAQRAESLRIESVNRAESFLLKDPVDDGNLDGLINAAASDPDDPHGFRQVRDTEDSIDVIVLIKGEDGGVRLPDGIGDHSSELMELGTPSAAWARAAASCTVSLPHSLSGRWIVDRVIDDLESAPLDLSGWQASPWLRGQLALVLDEDGRASLAGHPIHYTTELGLVVEPLGRTGAAA